MAQQVGEAPKIKPDWDIPDAWTVLEWRRGPDGERYPIVERDVTVEEKVAVLDADGNQRFRKDRKGNDLGAMHRIERTVEKKKYRGVWSPRGKLSWQEHFEPTPEEIEQLERNRAAARFNEELIREAAARGFTAKQLVERVLGAAPEESDPEPDEDPSEFPVHKGFGRWELSDGSTLEKGTPKDVAVEMEAALHGDAGEPPGG